MKENLISRESVMMILNETMCCEALSTVHASIESLPYFPAPNPDWRHNDKNIMGQTETEFWVSVDGQC